MFKNIEKYGLSKSFDGKYQFTARVLNPLETNQQRVGAVALGNSKKEKVETASANLNTKQEAPTKQLNPSKRRNKVESAFGYGNGGAGSNYGMTGSAVSSATPYLGVLEGIIPEDDWHTKRKIYKDIYTYDLAGAVVDLISTLPFSDFNLVGINDPAIIEGYTKAIQDLHLPELMPSITTDYLVNGAFIGSLNWSDTDNKFTCLMPHDLDDCEITSLGIIGADPIIDVTLPEEVTSVLQKKNDNRVQRLLHILPEYIKQAASSGRIELNPVTTLYVPRRGMSDPESGGSSYFNRIITIHLLEKALIKGTIETAQRRQRPIMHIQAGIQDEWEPTNQELSELASYFLSADLDPISGIVVTRNGVNISDVKNPRDLWGWNDIFDFSTNAKMRALGVNDAVLSGDASFNTLESSLSAFMDNVSNTRDIMTNATFKNRIFPIIAYKNNYKVNNASKDSSTILASNKNIITSKSTITAGGTSLFELGDISQYNIPDVQWIKQLKPKADKDYLELLKELKDLGVPIALRAFAAAGGENIDDLVNSMEDDNDMRLEIAEKYKDLIDEAVKEKTEMFLGIENIEELLNNDNSNNEDSTFAKLTAYAKENSGIINRKNKFRNLQDADNIYGVREYDSNGKRRILTANQKIKLEDKIHRQLAEALSYANEKEISKQK